MKRKWPCSVVQIESLRFNCDFDQAASLYETIVAEFPDEAEAYWGLVLCKYGIEYVDDPATGKKIPTCHRTSFDNVMDDGNFEIVIKKADILARQVYLDEGQKIENLRKDILTVSSKEKPYDIFISYKEKDDNGERTIDSVLAQDIYDQLTAKGYRVSSPGSAWKTSLVKSTNPISSQHFIRRRSCLSSERIMNISMLSGSK